MRHFGIAARAGGLAAALACAGGLAAQDLPQMPVVPAPLREISLAEQIYQAGLGDSRAAAIAAESAGFADRMAAVYPGTGEGENWRAEVARIHDPGRVSALLLAEIAAQLTPAVAADPRLDGVLGATGVGALPDGQGMELAARIELARPSAFAAVSARMQADAARGAAVLRHIDAMIAAEDPVAGALARRMNRELGFARGFSDAGGFDFPTSLDDAAADLTLQLPELRQEAAARTRLTWYAAFAPLGPAAVDRIASLRQQPESRALHALMMRAEGVVLDRLAAETGRAAARRLKGTPL